MHFLDSIVGWIAIGAAASLAGMMWPFQRGATGILLNLVLGIGGAIAGASASLAFIHGSNDAPFRLAFAAVGSLFALSLAHFFWSRHAGAHHPS